MKVENKSCPYTEQLVRVVEKAGSMEIRERYIQQDSKRLNKHKQLKQASLLRRKQRQSEVKDNRDKGIS
jgi:hypothetical protein